MESSNGATVVASPAGRAASRSAELLAREEERLLACVHCGFCLQACPTYVRLGDEADSPRGRLHLMRAVVEGRLDPGADAFREHIDRCLGCRACETVCPAGVEYGFLLERARAAIAAEAGLPLPTRLILAVFASRTFTRLAMLGARVLRGTGLAALLLRVLPERFSRARFGLAMLEATTPWRGLADGRTSTARAGEQGADGGRAKASLRGAAEPGRTPRLRVAVLTGCVQEGLFARVNRATVRVLEENGCEVVEVRAQGCCGALHAHAGRLDEARELARANIDAFAAAGVDHVVANAAGCGAAMREYGELLADDPAYAERARQFAASVRDVSELLSELGPVPGGPLPLRVTYDAPCHLHHAQHVTTAPLQLLDAIPGLERVPLPGADECCGGAGIYGVMHPELGGRILQDKLAAIRSTGASVVVTGNPGCAMQIGAGLRLAGDSTPVLHLIELLAESYRRRTGSARANAEEGGA
ncbi:MAG TPA: heterodisulfide reductase-related iron-sulfur binding cluster [Longimicrobiales bacterium]|nr:heterodisulfide reductase-related iron-sulfur binding cluster [Longimicrobiales bacterium]